MSPDQATEIGRRIINTMRPTPALTEWVEVLQGQDFDRALRTFRELRDRTDEGLRIGRWMAAYERSGGGSATGARARRGEPSDSCEWCHGSGWEPGESRWATIKGEPHEYTTVQPCRCTNPPGRDVPVDSLPEEASRLPF